MSEDDGVLRTDAGKPPLAPRAPLAHERHGHRWSDEYHWLRQRESEEVLEHLRAENAYTDAVLEPLKPFIETLYEEIKTRRKQTDASVPVRFGAFEYYTRVVEGLEHPIFCRRPARSDPTHEATEQVLLDVNALAEDGRPVFLGAFKVAFDHRTLAYSLDEDGSERFTLTFKDLTKDALVGERIANTADAVAWAPDGQALYYVELDDARRPHRVRRHTLGSDPQSDPIVLEEPDERFFVHVETLRSRRFVSIAVESKTTSEVWLVDAADPEAPPVCVAPRREGVEYEIDHHGDSIYLITNDEAVNFELRRIPLDGLGDPSRSQVVLEHDPDTLLEGLDLFEDHLVLWIRSQGLTGVKVQDLTSGGWHALELPEAVYTVRPGPNVEFETQRLRLHYSSPVTPDSVFDYDMLARELVLLKQDEIFGGFDPRHYAVERIWADAGDGTRVPISLAWRRAGIDAPDAEEALPRERPCLIYGYGSYGISSDPRFSPAALSLLDRGVVYAIAHVRGGGEMGRPWYDAGKLENKANTFDDFICCAEELVRRGVTRPERLAIHGGSAGGMLVGVVLNQRPELFAAAVAQVPFVDVLNTMLDPSLPLTVTEYEEWGNPNEPEAFARMRDYAPYENVREQEYPNLLVTAGINDPRVQYWEPAKWVARLRARSRGDGLILLKTQMEAGHGGPSGRYQRLREIALVYGFVLDRIHPRRPLREPSAG
jgi:oligopeptidase B